MIQLLRFLDVWPSWGQEPDRPVSKTWQQLSQTSPSLCSSRRTSPWAQIFGADSCIVSRCHSLPAKSKITLSGNRKVCIEFTNLELFWSLISSLEMLENPEDKLPDTMRVNHMWFCHMCRLFCRVWSKNWILNLFRLQTNITVKWKQSLLLFLLQNNKKIIIYVGKSSS